MDLDGVLLIVSQKRPLHLKNSTSNKQKGGTRMKLSKNSFKKEVFTVCGIFLFTALGCSSSTDMHGEKAMTASAKTMTDAKVMVSPSPVPYQRKVKVTISGTGFAPNQELELLIPIGGVLSDISAMVKPKPKTDAKGTFSTVWILDNEIRAKLMEPTSYTLEIANTDGETLAKVPFVLEKVETKKK
jgi:hypothetical protein